MSGISFPGSLTLVTMDSLLQHFKPFGFTKRSFIYFLKALGVFSIRTPDRTMLVDFDAFTLSTRIAVRLGADFYAPSHPLASAGRLPKTAISRLTPEIIEENWERAVDELVASHNAAAKMKSSKELRNSYVAAKTSIINELTRLTLNGDGRRRKERDRDEDGLPEDD